MNPLISVCIPAYNNSAYISETINSILSQSYPNLELVIVDDRSTDDTAAQIKKFSDRRIRFYENDRNLGMHGNWNRALSLCTGEYIKLVCGDDLIHPDCLSRQLAVFMAPGNEGLALVACKRKIVTDEGKEMFGSFYKLPGGKYSGRAVMKACVSLGTNLIGEPMAVLLKGDVLRENGIVLGSNNYMIDMDMYSKMLQHGGLVMMKEFLASFRVHAGSMTGSMGMKKHSQQFREFVNQPWLRKAFGVSGLHRALGRLIEFNLSLARGLVIKMSGK